MRDRWLGGVLLLAGAALIASALWPGPARWQVERTPQPIPGDFKSRYPIERFARWRLYDPASGRHLSLYVARYRSEDGKQHQAILPTPGTPQWRHWQALGGILRQLEADAMILAWWDDAQRVDLLSGRKVWVRQPPADAFPPQDRKLWRHLSGGLGDHQDRLAQLAKLFGAPSTAWTGGGQHRYLLLNAAILTRIDEMERLNQRSLPLAVRIFSDGDNLHAQIAAVRHWAEGKPYLPLKVPGGIAAWRLEVEDKIPLLLRLLPFTGQPTAPPPGWKKVFQSRDRRLQLYRLP